MHKSHHLLRRYIKEITLAESSGASRDLAVVLKDKETEKSAAFYDAGIFLQSMKDLDNDLRQAAEKAAVAYIKIKAPYRYPCKDAWVISLSWGPGLGEMVYGAAYALSPTHTLVPDRRSVSSSAAAGWKKAFHKGDIVKTPIDSVEDHLNKKPHDARRKKFLNDLGFDDHTDDTHDDCELYIPTRSGNPESFEHLNFYYDGSSRAGRYLQMLQDMQRRNDEVLKELTSFTEEEFASGPQRRVFEPDEIEEEIFDVVWGRAIDEIGPAV